MKQKTIEVFFLGREMYEESRSGIGVLYTVDKKRFDWGQVETVLEQGHKVNIRPATDEELMWAYREMNLYKKIK